jgi:DNA polymerase-3 subunit alpha
MGIKLLPPDVNESGADFTVSGDDIRFGLVAIKGIGWGFINGLWWPSGSKTAPLLP